MPPPRFREFLACFRKGSTHLAPVSPVCEPPEYCGGGRKGGGLRNAGARLGCSAKPDQGRDQPQAQWQPRTLQRPDCIDPSPAVNDGRFRRNRGGEPLPGSRRLREAFPAPPGSEALAFICISRSAASCFPHACSSAFFCRRPKRPARRQRQCLCAFVSDRPATQFLMRGRENGPNCCAQQFGRGLSVKR